MSFSTNKIWIVSLCIAAMYSAQATTYWVNDDSPVQVAPYTNDWNQAAHSVQQVLPYVQDGDMIMVSEGTYTLSSSIVVTNDLNIRAFWTSTSDEVVFDGQGLYTCFNLGDTDTYLSSFTIRNGKDAGVLCTGTQPVVYNCIIENTDGTGMIQGQAVDSVFRNNTGAYYGGGANGTIATGCSFINNQANYGGGSHTVAATDCTFQNNVSTREGGALNNSTATNCLIIGNTAAGNGGGLYRGSAVGCAISGNRSAGYGGGLYQTKATHCTITENTANIGGGMCYSQAYNSILWNNSASDQSPDIYGTTIYSCCLPDNTSNGSITNNPQLVSFSHLSTNSPCIAAANPTYPTSLTDIDGETWFTPASIGCDDVYIGYVNGWMEPYNNLPERLSSGQEIYFSAYVDGPVTWTVLDFGDGTAITNTTDLLHSHSWAYGNYHVVLTGYNDNHPEGLSITNTVFVRNDTTTAIYVSEADGLDTNNGESWATAKQTIQAGVDTQDFIGGLVLVSNGTYSITSQIVVDKDIRIESLSGPEETILEGETNHRTLNLGNQQCRITGFTIREGGYYDPSGGTSGGTIYCTSHDPVVENCLITGNTGNGGGVMWRGTATNCTFSLNAAGNGPGAMQSGIAIDCLFENNQGNGGGSGGGAMGGGIATRCIFKNNTNVKPGGAMYGGTAYDCQFIENTTTHTGGGAHNSTVYNCVFSGNKANSSGGGMYGGSATHCTITANRATDGGGTSATTLDHCIVWYNEALNSFDNTQNGTITTSCAPNLEHGVDGNITNNPQLVSASHIKLSSPCAGSGTILRDTVDIDGEHWRTTPAIGCDEPADPPTGNVAITINGPAEIPAGFDAFYTVDFQGALEQDQIDFGDGLTATGSGIIPFGHIWDTPGTYDLVVTAWNNNYQDTYSVTNTITVYEADFNTIYVRTDGDDSKNGRSWFNAKQTIQAAIDEQELHGGRVVVSNGVYTLTSTIIIDKDIQLIGLNGAESTIVDAVDLYGLNYQRSRAMEIGDNHSTITGLTIRNANYGWTGAGIFCDYSSDPIISDCIFTNNSAGKAGGMCYGTAIGSTFIHNTASAGQGGGLYIANATDCEFSGNYSRDGGGGMYRGTATDCSFIENTGGYGSGMREGTATGCTFENNDANYGGGTHSCTVSDSVFSGNTAVQGGGIHGGSATDCTFIGNASETHGGAIFQATATRCIVSGNRAENGGGISYGEAYSCSISGNKAYDTGGGTHSTKLYNCTVTGNSASKAGGVQGQTWNCIVWGNTATEGMNDINDGNTSLNYIKNTCSPDAPHGTDGSITNNPLLISASSLSAGSPCIGAGNAAYATGTDLNGDAWATFPAMGCDEVGATLTGPITMSLIGPSPIRVYTVGNYTALFEGQVSQTVVDFGDGAPRTNAVGSISKGWNSSVSSNVDVILTGFNDTYPQGISYTQVVAVVSTADSDIHVKHFGNDLNDGASWATAKETIQAGVDAQNIYGGRVLLDASRYVVTETIQIDKPILLTSGSDGITGTLIIPVIDGGGSNRCFNLGYSECVLEDLTIRNGAASTLGYSNNEGGGILCANGAPRITYSTIENCVAYNGAGVFKGTLENCTLSNNVASANGGATYQSTLNNSTISSNSAKYGGGVYAGLLNGCTLSNNTATTIGGGAYLSTVTFSTVTDNTAPSGGGLASCTADRCDILFNYATSGHGGGLHQGTAQNSTIHNNGAIQYGGGSYSTTLLNCTVVENGADNGGGVYGGSMYNTIIWSNFAWSANSNLTSTSPRSSCYPEADHEGYYGNITNAPLFVSYPAGLVTRGSDYYLSNFSPCLNAGDNSRVSTEKDYNGWDRILLGKVDIGACEMYVGGDSDGDGMGDGWELENFGGVTNAVATDYSDADPIDNLGEYIAGTDPFDPDSYFRITQQEITEDGMVLHWDSVYNRSYQVFWSDSLTNEFQEIRPAVRYPENTYSVESTNSTAFFQIKVQID